MEKADSVARAETSRGGSQRQQRSQGTAPTEPQPLLTPVEGKSPFKGCGCLLGVPTPQVSPLPCLAPLSLSDGTFPLKTSVLLLFQS